MRFISVPMWREVTFIILGKHNECWFKRSWWRLERQDANYWGLETTRYIHYPHNSQWPRRADSLPRCPSQIRMHALTRSNVSALSCILHTAVMFALLQRLWLKGKEKYLHKTSMGRESDWGRENLNYLDVAVKQHVFNEYYSYLMVALKFEISCSSQTQTFAWKFTTFAIL